ncbi:carboxypeptidase regulatory-like domain-containing protein [Candidatus Palauibacter sp.]|uniref:carboxypeptidase regulatory-like domain-containing protein n=1 Tax=Candidatus Palauibacter sp. TaxID=3101350 RepID=UPI003B5A255C
MVLDELGAVALPGAAVVVSWMGGVAAPVRAVTEPDGSLLVCVPADAAGAQLWAGFGDLSSELAMVTIANEESVGVELRVSMPQTDEPGRIIGQVYDALTERPVATAAISVLGRPRVVESNGQGWFVLDDVPGGTRELEVRRLGYAPLRHTVTVTRDRTTEVEIGLVPAPVEMEPLVATATRSRRLEIKGFYERKRWGERTGNGYFFDPDYIERWRPSSVETMVRMAVPGVGRGLTNRRMSVGFSDSPCKMRRFLDGIDVTNRPVPVLMIEVLAVEVYKGPASLAAGFGGSDARCGAIAIWTK